MQPFRSFVVFLGVCAVCAWLLAFPVGCIKEYSYEDGRDTLGARGSVPTVVDLGPNFISCPSCVPKEVDGEWYCKAGNAQFCGVIDTAIVMPERTAFTFFGPSKCSLNSGLIISAYMDAGALNRDLQQVVINKVAFYYYDNISGGYMLMSRVEKPFRLVLSYYDHATRKASGSFSGFAYTSNGKEVFINEGKFLTYLK